jgi:hypothetical protein
MAPIRRYFANHRGMSVAPTTWQVGQIHRMEVKSDEKI